MGGYIKFDGVGGDGFLKLGDLKELKAGPLDPKGWSQNSRAKLASMGLSQVGIQALIGGQPVQNPNDQKIIAAILQALVK